LTHTDDEAIPPTRRGNRPYPLHASLSADGKLLATAITNGTVRLWDLAAGKELRQIAIGRKGLNSLVLSPDGKTLAVSSRDSNIRLYQTSTGKEVRSLDKDDPQGHVLYFNSPPTMTFSPSGKLLVISGPESEKDAIKRG